jgi:hypothetical protein
MKCGSHWEWLTFERVKCIWSDNTVAISHRRASQIIASLEKQADRGLEPAS